MFYDIIKRLSKDSSLFKEIFSIVSLNKKEEAKAEILSTKFFIRSRRQNRAFKGADYTGGAQYQFQQTSAFRPRKLIFFAAIFLFAVGLEELQATPPAETKDPPINFLQETVTKERLENGLTVVIREDQTQPIISIALAVGAGLSSEGKYCGSGISHFIEHMIFKGTPGRPSGEVEKEMKSYGGIINASTELDSANYYITVPSEYRDQALGLLSDIVFKASFDAGELEKERDVILNEIKLNEDDPTRRLLKNLWQNAYLEHPYKMPIIGEKNFFRKLDRDDLVNYHSLRYVPRNMVLAVVGDVKKSEILSKIKSLFGGEGKRGDIFIAVPREPQQNFSRLSVDYSEINLGYVALGFHTVELSNQDLYALDVLGIVLGDWDESRLSKRLVKQDEFLYSVGSFNYTPKYPGLFIIYGVGKAENLEDAKTAILDEIKRISTGEIREGELEAAKNIIISSYITSLETMAGLAKNIAQSQFFTGDAAFSEKYVENIKRVDKNILKETAKKYLHENNITVSYLYPQSFRKSLPASQSNLDDRQIVSGEAKRLVLQNGIRLILKEDHRLPKVSVVSVFLGGLRVETDENNGISNLTSAMLLKGTTKRKEAEIKSFLESKGAAISHFSGNNTFGLSLDFLSPSRNDALDILEDVLKNAIFPENELEKEKKKLFAAISQEEDDIYATGLLRLRKAIFGGHPYGLRVVGEVDSLTRLTRKHLLDFRDKFCVSNNTVIAVVGDFDSSGMQLEIERRFGNMKNLSLNIDVSAANPIAEIQKIEFTMPRSQSLVAIGFGGTTLKGPERFYLDILSSILSGQDGRLYHAIRNRFGFSYALDTFSTPGIDKGYMASFIGTDSLHMEEVRSILIKELEAVRNGAISGEELELAKKSLIGQQKISLQSFGAMSYQMALDEIYGLGYDAYKNYPETINNISAENVAEAARKYLDLQNCAILSVTGIGEND